MRQAIRFLSDGFRCAIWHQLPCALPVSIHVNAIRHQLSCALPVSIVSTCGYEVFFRCRIHCIIDVVCHMAPIAERSTCLHGSISLVDVSFAADSVPYGTNCRALYLSPRFYKPRRCYFRSQPTLCHMAPIAERSTSMLVRVSWIGGFATNP